MNERLKMASQFFMDLLQISVPVRLIVKTLPPGISGACAMTAGVVEMYLDTEQHSEFTDIEVLAHEMVHAEQLSSGVLLQPLIIGDLVMAIWLGKPFILTPKEMATAPWELEAYEAMKPLAAMFEAFEKTQRKEAV